MAIIKCKACGGDLIIREDDSVAECEFCGVKQTLPKGNSEAVQNLFNRANALRLRCDFDKAEQLYEKILQEDDAEPEAHWGIVLCRYGIEYVEDPATFRRVPTCHRTSYDAILADSDYLAAIEHADGAQRSIYEAEARAIDEIQKNILSIVKEEKPFDVFICYKETDESGKRTVDSTIANEIYYELTDAGYKVFYAAITLEDKLGQEYEPYIFAALNSAKVMLAIGTKPEYFTSPWVKNEWSRYLKLMKTDRTKQLFPCYRDMDAYELPEEFARLQAQDMSKIGFINDIVRGIRKVITKDAPPQEPVREKVVTAPAAAGTTAPLLRRAFLFLEDRDWENADEYCEKVLDIDPENAQAYLGKLMVEAQVKFPEQLGDTAMRLDNSNNYQKALRFGDEGLRKTLRGYNEASRDRIEKQRLARQQEEEERRRRADEERRVREAREAEERRIREQRETEERRIREEKANREREAQRKRDEARRQEEERRAAAEAEARRKREEELQKRITKHKNLRTIWLCILAACSVVGGVFIPELAPPAGVIAMFILQAYFLFPTALALRKRKWGDTPVIFFAITFSLVQLFAGLGFATNTEVNMEPITGICLIVSALASVVIMIIRKKI